MPHMLRIVDSGVERALWEKICFKIGKEHMRKTLTVMSPTEVPRFPAVIGKPNHGVSRALEGVKF